MSNPLFTSIPLPKVSRNTFKLSHNNKFTMTAQKNYPVLLMETLPGDRHLVLSELFARAMPLRSPVFQSYSISQHAFFVPMRTLSKNWENFITGGKDGTYSSVLPYTTYAYIFQKVSASIADLDRLYDGETVGEFDWQGNLGVSSSQFAALVDVCRNLDFMGLSFSYESVSGLPWVSDSDIHSTAVYLFLAKWLELNASFVDCEVPVNLLPFAAALKVWSEYYRDENLVSDVFQEVVNDHLALDTSVGFQNIAGWSLSDFIEFFMMRPRAWKKDRFTSALPFTQRGPDVLLPIAGTAPVQYSVNSAVSDFTGRSVLADNDDSEVTLRAASGGSTADIKSQVDFADADLATTINDFRRAERLQRWYENSARGGSRLNENTLAHWGVHTPDATLDRAVFLGGINQPLVISEVEQNSQTTAQSAQGTLAGKGTSYNNGKLFKHYDSEHGYIIVFASILQHADYCQGTPRVFTRQDRYEYAWPEFANLGEEPIMTRELYTLAGNDDVFGYTPRYSDYKSMPSEVHGDMRTSLDFWAVPRLFGNKPVLNEEFIYNAPDKMAFAVQSGETDEFVVTARFGIKSSRLLPFYGVPTI